MKLYIFETCPYCLRVRIFARMRGLDPELKYLTPGILPAHLEGTLPKFSVPILEDNETILQESGAIICYLDDADAPLLHSYAPSQAYNDWKAEVSHAMDALLYPRMLDFAPPELSARSARQWFSETMPKRISMSFEEALTRTEEFHDQIHIHFPKARDILEKKGSFDRLCVEADLTNLRKIAKFNFLTPP